MNQVMRVVLPVLVVLVAVVAARVLIAQREPPERRDNGAPPPLVEFVTLQPQNYAVTLHSRGVVRPRTEGELIPQVSGSIVEIGANFRNGGFFEPDDLLLRIDPRDYVAAVTVAEAELTQAKLRLEEENARAEQARRDLDRLKLDRPPSALALREPQLAGANASVAAAEARLAQAKLNLERTEIRAPYAGRVLAQSVDVGQSVAPGQVLGSIYAVDYVEVRLPLTNTQLAQVELPEAYRGETPETDVMPKVMLSARIGDRVYEWAGRIVRSEGAIDTASRHTFVIAQVDDPYAANEAGRPPLKVGQFVEASIAGRTLQDVYLVPRAAVSTDGHVYGIDAEDRLLRLAPEVVWQDAQWAVARTGLTPGQRVVTSALPLATPGMPVRTRVDKPESREAGDRG